MFAIPGQGEIRPCQVLPLLSSWTIFLPDHFQICSVSFVYSIVVKHYLQRQKGEAVWFLLVDSVGVLCCGDGHERMRVVMLVILAQLQLATPQVGMVVVVTLSDS